MVKFPSRDKKPKNHGKQMAGVVAGAALVGAVGTALFTPKAGKEVRRDIAKGGKAAVKKAEQTVKDVEKKFQHRNSKTTTRAAKTAVKPIKKTTAKTTSKAKTAVKRPSKPPVRP
jgi:gas vesicle protein